MVILEEFLLISVIFHSLFIQSDTRKIALPCNQTMESQTIYMTIKDDLKNRSFLSCCLCSLIERKKMDVIIQTLRIWNIWTYNHCYITRCMRCTNCPRGVIIDIILASDLQWSKSSQKQRLSLSFPYVQIISVISI